MLILFVCLAGCPSVRLLVCLEPKFDKLLRPSCWRQKFDHLIVEILMSVLTLSLLTSWCSLVTVSSSTQNSKQSLDLRRLNEC